MVLRSRMVAAVLLIAVLASAGCSRFLGRAMHHSQHASPPAATASPAPGGPVPSQGGGVTISTGPGVPSSIQQQWTTENLTKAFRAINNRIGANPADYLEVIVALTAVQVKAIDPKKRENVDEYEYRGTGGVEISPVDVSHNEPGAIEESKFSSDTVKPEVLSAILNSAIKDSGVEDAKVSSLTVDKTFANDPEPHISVPVSGPRGSKVLEYDLSGKLTRVI